MKEMILAHVEKAVLAICVALMGLFLWMSFSLKPYSRKPEDFSRAAQEANKRVESNEPQIDDLKPGNFIEAAESLTKPNDEQFPTLQLWRRALDFGTVFRGEPRILQPHKPAVQDNRGLMGQFLTDSQGNRITRKIKKSDRIFVSKTGFGANTGRGGMRMGGGRDEDEEGYGGPSNRRGGGAGVRGGGGSGRGMFTGNEGRGGTGREGFGLGDEFDDEGGAAHQVQGVEGRKARIVLGESVIKKREKKEDKNKKKAVEKDNEIVEEPQLGMVGRRWVEIVAAFPHADQIREFVKALREPATEVGLRYDMARVERRELLGDLTRSEWGKIDLEKQYRVIENAYAFQPEPFPQVTIKGLAMNIPLLTTQFKNFLTLPEFNEPKRSFYEKEYLDMTLNAPKRTKQGDRTKSSSKPKIGKEKKSEKWQVSRLGKMWGKEDLSRPKGKDEKGKDEKGAAVEDRNVFNNRHEVELAMIRFFDFTVEPGRRYQYRVAVQTFNPNYLRNDVASGDISTRPVLTGPPSEPSDDVVVESDVHWYVVKQDARNAENQFPRPKIEVHYWDDKMGEWLVTTFLHRLGDYIGVSGAKKIIKKVRFDSNTLTWKLTTESSDQEFNARAILIDFRGGNVVKPLGDEKSVTFKLPREMVAVNQFGDLIRRDQDSDVANEVRRAVVTNYEDLVKELESSEQSSGNAGNLGRNMLGGDDEDRGRGGRGGSRKGAGKAAGKAGPRGGGGGSGAGSAG